MTHLAISLEKDCWNSVSLFLVFFDVFELGMDVFLLVTVIDC